MDGHSSNNYLLTGSNAHSTHPIWQNGQGVLCVVVLKYVCIYLRMNIVIGHLVINNDGKPCNIDEDSFVAAFSFWGPFFHWPSKKYAAIFNNNVCIPTCCQINVSTWIWSVFFRDVLFGTHRERFLWNGYIVWTYLFLLGHLKDLWNFGDKH